MNMKWIAGLAAPMVALGFISTQAFAADPKEAAKPAEERIYGSQLMTPEERAQHRDAMRTAKTPEEREKIRKEHHEKMKQRAKERGVTLPDEPPMGKGMMGDGMGGGYRR